MSWGEVRQDIFIGSCPIQPTDIDRICDETGADSLLSLQTGDCRAALGVNYDQLSAHALRRAAVMVNTPMRDFDGEEQRKRLPDAVRALSDVLGRGYKTYVHCTAGINRSPLVVLAYLTFVEGIEIADAMSMIHRARPSAAPYWDAYYGCRQDALETHRAAIALRAWNLARESPAESPERNWFRAERETMRHVFVPKAGAPAQDG